MGHRCSCVLCRANTRHGFPPREKSKRKLPAVSYFEILLVDALVTLIFPILSTPTRTAVVQVQKYENDRFPAKSNFTT